MATPAAPALISAEEFLALPDTAGFELVDGRLEGNPMGAVSSWVSGELLTALNHYLRSNPIGFAFPQETGIAVWADRPDLVRKPDAVFVRRDRLPGGRIPDGWIRVTPGLVAEVVSPNGEAGRLEAKIDDSRDAGIPLVWIVYPETRTACAHRGQQVEFIDTDGVLDGGDVLPGFRLPLAERFAAAGDAI
jgi:Uma2 family endonuclease